MTESIEATAKRVLELDDGGWPTWWDDDLPLAALPREYHTLAPKLAEWVEKALPAMRRMIEAYGVEFFGSQWRTNSTHSVACGPPDDDEMDQAWSALRALVDPLDPPPPLAAEGTDQQG